MDASKSETDEELVRRCQAGDNGAFERLVLRYQETVFRLIYHIVGKNADIEDIAQEVFLRVYKGISKFRFDAAFKTWLTRITLNYCLKFLNKQKAKPLFERFRSFLQYREASQQASIEKEEQRTVVKQALDKLSPKYRTVVVLHYFEEHTCEEISEIIGCSVGTVKSRLYHARKKLKELLAPYFYEGELSLPIEGGKDCEMSKI